MVDYSANHAVVHRYRYACAPTVPNQEGPEQKIRTWGPRRTQLGLLLRRRSERLAEFLTDTIVVLEAAAPAKVAMGMERSEVKSRGLWGLDRSNIFPSFPFAMGRAEAPLRGRGRGRAVAV